MLEPNQTLWPCLKKKTTCFYVYQSQVFDNMHFRHGWPRKEESRLYLRWLEPIPSNLLRRGSWTVLGTARGGLDNVDDDEDEIWWRSWPKATCWGEIWTVLGTAQGDDEDDDDNDDYSDHGDDDDTRQPGEAWEGRAGKIGFMDRSGCFEICPTLTRVKFYHRQQNHDLFTGTMPSQKNLTGSYRNGLKPWKRKIKTYERQLVPSFKGKHPTCAQFEKNWDIRWKAKIPNLCPVWMQSRLGALCMWWSFLQLCLWHTVCLYCAILTVIQSLRQTFSIVLLQSRLHIAVFINTHISDLNR